VDIADARGCTALHLAAASGQLSLARLLVEAAGANLQVRAHPTSKQITHARTHTHTNTHKHTHTHTHTHTHIHTPHD
jgi:hypothetical protein